MKKIEFNQKDEIVPNWIKKGNYETSIDKYYTNKDVAKYCYKNLLKVAKEYGFDSGDYIFIEPSAGKGAFSSLLPKDRRISMDVFPEDDNIIKKDFFDWKPDENKKYITVGNPPFGHRSWLALEFINRASEFSDLVGFILPMYFDSDGKGSAKSRVRNLALLHSEELPPDSFHNKEPIKINTVWQVWGKCDKTKVKDKTCNEYVDIYTVCTYPSRKCGLDKLNEYSLFIPSTYYSKVKVCKKFEDVNYGSGIGVIIKKKKKKVEDYLSNVNWLDYSMRATNHCNHIGIKHVIKAMVDGGFIDGRRNETIAEDNKDAEHTK